MALVCDVHCDFVTFSFGNLGQMWYLIVSTPDPCCLSFHHRPFVKSVYLKYIFSYFSIKTYVVGTQKNCLNEMVLMSAQNIC